ncbi:hypothetical protein HZU40_18470 [Mycolicibacterium fluoranthenivorans]|jgi:hypothetical protein|uniref:Uncharacterized protein n=1 Tax=Mycolicibacterium fluoranthenivorans TaxID=258505 RepID=A0A1G4WDJ7_9MYCO|nr:MULTISPECIES: hypothetical protein [Mycobacteriaceae]MCV7256596.1 hypothetical protein [Mycobacterium hackensackense]QNJ90268.1 hypothetical protein HZU40_18470 [Mycolicibacterium fluoranthenivorans]SCX20873.1 hypothetical protein SAMN02799620_02996 [Mycolicibacterium fluoranthenivorans]
MTALQDWLGIAPLAQRTVRSFVSGALRATTPAAPPRREPKAMRRGVERC